MSSDDPGVSSCVRGPQDLTPRQAQDLIADGDGGRYNEDALLYDDHSVNYPQHLRRRYWIKTVRRTGVIIRDDPSGPVPCRLGYDHCNSTDGTRGGRS